MGVKVSKIEPGMRPEAMNGKEAMFLVNHLKETERTKKDGKGKFMQYQLGICGESGEWVGDFNLNFLMGSDLQDLVEKWGEDSDAWKGQLVSVSTRKEGEYYRWVLKAVEEKVK